MRRIAVTCVLWALTGQLARAESADTCVLEELPTLGGPSSTFDINNEGDIVGTSFAPNGLYAVVWRRGQIQALESLPNGGSAAAVGINDGGTVVGSAFPGDRLGPVPVAWIRGRVVPLRVPEGTQGGAAAINNRGQIVGSVGVNGEPHCLLWNDVRARPVDLGIAGSCSPNAINEQGVVVGEVTRPGGGLAAFRWHRGAVTWLPAPPSVTGSWASDVNASGTIAGNTLDTANLSRATSWSPDLSPTIFDLPGSISPSINDRGDVAVAVRLESGGGRLIWIERNATIHELATVSESPSSADVNNRRQAVWTVGSNSFVCRFGR